MIRRISKSPQAAKVTVISIALTVLLAGSGLAQATDAPFLRGDANGDGTFDISDGLTVLRHLFLGTPATLGCDDAADINDSGSIDVSDALYALRYLFGGGTEPPVPFHDCGVDETSDALSCADYDPCEANVIHFAGAANSVISTLHPFTVLESDELEFVITATTDERSGSVVTFILQGAYGDEILRESWLTTTNIAPIVTLDDRGRLFQDLHPSSFVIEATGETDYTVDLFISPRPGYNSAGTDFTTAPELTSPATVAGNLRGEGPGHYYQVTVPDGQTVLIGGLFTGPANTGTNFQIDLYDGAQNVLSASFLHNVAYGQVEGENTYTNSTGADLNLYIHVFSISVGDTRELEDYQLDVEVGA